MTSPNEFVVSVRVRADAQQHNAEFAGAGSAVQAFAAAARTSSDSSSASLQAVTVQAKQLADTTTSSAAQAQQALASVTTAAQSAGAGLQAQSAQQQQAGQAAARAIDQVSKANAVGTISAAQHAAAMRMLPAQMTDVVTSLAGGMPIWMVAIQQGGQIKDSFGGAGNALKAMAGAVTPAAAALGVMAAVGGAVALAYKQGSSEADILRREVVMTGNAAGTSVGQLTDMARAVGELTTTQGAATQVLAQLAGTGVVANDNLQQFSETAINLERYVGQPVKATVQHLEQLGKAPLEASVKLNEQYHYLTDAVYKQIKALQDQGKHDEAASLAQRTYSQAMAERSAEMRSHMGTLERGWDSLGRTAARAWDAMLNIGRAASLSDIRTKIDATNTELNKLLYADGFSDTGGGAATGGGSRSRTAAIARLRKELGELQAQATPLEAQEFEAQAKAEKQAKDQAEVEARGRIETMRKAVRTRAQIRQDEVNQLNRDRKTLELSTAEYNKLLAGIEQKYKDPKSSTAGQVSITDTQLAGLRSQLQAAELYGQQLRTMGTAASELNAGERESLKLAEQIKLATNGKTKAKLEQAKAEADALGVQLRSNDGLEKSLKSHQALIDANNKDATSIEARAREQEAANTVIGKGRTAIEQMTLATLEHQLAEAEGSDHFDPAYIAGLERKIAAQKRYVDALGQADYKAVIAHADELLRNANELSKVYSDELALSGLTGLEREKIVAQRQVELKYAKEIAAIDKSSLTDSEKIRAKETVYEAQRIESAATVAKVTQSYNARNSEEINRTLTDALMRGFESGKGFAENLADTTKNLFNTMVLRPMISAVMSPVSGAINGVVQSGLSAIGLGGSAGSASAGLIQNGLSIASLGKNISGAITGGFEALGGQVATYVQSGMNMLSGSGGAVWQGPVQVGGVAQGVGAAAGVAAGVAGGVYGGRLISGGYSAFGGASGNSAVNTGTAVGAAIGSIVPVIGTALGALVGGLLGGTVNRLFGRKLKDQGIEGTFGGEEAFEGNSYKFMKGGWFRSDKTERSALDEELRKGLADQYSLMRLSTSAMSDVLGLGTAAIDGFTASVKVSFNGLTEEEIEKRLAEEFDKVAEGLAGVALGTTDYSKAGETAVQSLTRLSGSLTAVNGVFDQLSTTLYASSLAGADMSSSLLELFGGADGFATASGTYFQNYYSSGEQRDALERQLNAALAKVNLELPDIDQSTARAQYRALAEAQDLTTDSGRKAWATLMQVSGSFAQLTQSSDDLAKSADDLAKSAAQAQQDASKAAVALRANLIGLESKFSGGGHGRAYQVEDAAATVSALFASVGIDKGVGELAAKIKSATSDDVEQYFREMWSVLPTTEARQQLVDVTTALLGMTSAAGSLAEAATSSTRSFGQAAAAALSARTSAGSLLDRINGELGGDGTAYALKREQELWSGLATASYAQQIDLAGQLTESVLGRMQLEKESAEKLSSIHRSLRDSIEATRIGALSPLTLGQQLKEAGDQFNAAVAKAKGGDTEAASQVASLRQSYLALAQRYYAASDDYTAVFQASEDAVRGLAGQMQTDAERQLSASQSTVSELQRLRDVAQSAYQQADRDYVASSAAAQAQATLLASMDGGITSLGEILEGLPVELAAQLQPLLGAGSTDAALIATMRGAQDARPELMLSSLQQQALAGGASATQVARVSSQLYSDADVAALLQAGRANYPTWSMEQLAALGKSQYGIGREQLDRVIDGSHANGLAYVPFDGYLAELHRGETVLPERQAEIFRSIDFSQFGRGFDAIVTQLREVQGELSQARSENAQLMAMLAGVMESTGNSTGQQLRQAVREVALAGVKPR